MDEWSEVLKRWISKLEDGSSIFSLSSGVAGFAIWWACAGPFLAVPIGLAVFAICAAAEFANRDAKLKLDRRSKPTACRLIHDVSRATGKDIVKLHELKHGGLKFSIFGVHGEPFALSISAPLCPRCGDRVAERSRVFHVIRTRITFLCSGCGFTMESDQTGEEIRQECAKVANLPIDG